MKRVINQGRASQSHPWFIQEYLNVPNKWWCPSLLSLITHHFSSKNHLLYCFLVICPETAWTALNNEMVYPSPSNGPGKKYTTLYLHLKTIFANKERLQGSCFITRPLQHALSTFQLMSLLKTASTLGVWCCDCRQHSRIGFQTSLSTTKFHEMLKLASGI